MKNKRYTTPTFYRLVKRTVKVCDVMRGPVIHKQLPAELEERLRKVEPVFAEVLTMPHAEWVTNFQRDLYPESEVCVWEAMAVAYQALLAKYPLSLDAKKEAVGLLCGGSFDRPKRHLTPAQAAELAQSFAEAFAKTQKPHQPN